MKKIFCLLIIFSAGVFAQSGRVKKDEPANDPKAPSIPVHLPKSGSLVSFPTPTPKPSPSPKKQDDEEVISIDSALVPLPVSVTDQFGKAVSDLKIEDFELKVDGVSAEVSELARSESSIKLVMLFDNSSSVFQAREFEQKAAIRFFKQVLRPQKDLAALFSVSTATRLEQPFTKDVSQLVRAIEFIPQPNGATALLDGVVKASEYLKDTQGRRVIVIVSDGEDTISDVSLEDTLKFLQIRNCQVYVVKTTDFENYTRSGQRTVNANVRVLAAERRMQELASQTGGSVYSPIDEKELDLAFRRISAELSQQYILSLYIDPKEKRTQFREIGLTVRNRPGLTIRTRKGYQISK